MAVDYKQNACEFITSTLFCKGCAQLALVMCSACKGFYCPDCPRCACQGGEFSEVDFLNDEFASMFVRLKDMVKAELEEAPVSKPPPQAKKIDELATESKSQASPEPAVTRARRSMTRPKRFDQEEAPVATRSWSLGGAPTAATPTTPSSQRRRRTGRSMGPTALATGVKVGDLVYAKVAGYAKWPAKVTHILNASKVRVIFFNDKTCADITKENIFAFTPENARQYLEETRYEKLKDAIHEMMDASIVTKVVARPRKRKH